MALLDFLFDPSSEKIREAIRKGSLDTLSSEEGRRKIFGGALEALISEDGRRKILALFAETNVASGLRQQVNAMRSELVAAIDKATINARQSTLNNAVNEVTRSIENRAVVLFGGIEKKLSARVDQIVKEHAQSIERAEVLLAEFEGKLRTRVDRVINEHAQSMVLEAVRDFVWKQPIEQAGMTNRETARANGLSIREVKRRRRAAQETGER